MYFFHTDHLGSTTYLTGREEVEQYIAYTPYGEPFVETRSVSPYKFNGKELDTETGLYYYGARYYNQATALWLGVDPLASKYPGVSPYVYCVGNPVKYVDPDGKVVHLPVAIALGATVGATISIACVAIEDCINGEVSSIGTYIGAAVGGAITGAITTSTGQYVAAGALGSGIGAVIQQTVDKEEINYNTIILSTAIGGACGKIPGQKIKGITKGRNSSISVTKQIETKIKNGTIKQVSSKTQKKIAKARIVDGALIEGTILGQEVTPILQEETNMILHNIYTNEN